MAKPTKPAELAKLTTEPDLAIRDADAEVEFSICVRLFTAARQCLLALPPDTEGHVSMLYARLMWRAAEVRFITLQLRTGDVVLVHSANVISTQATVQRISQQLRAKLIEGDPTAADEHTLENPPSLLGELVKLVSVMRVVFFERSHTATLDTDIVAVQDWYRKMTFITALLTNTSEVRKQTTMRFVHDARFAHYINYESTIILKSFQVLTSDEGDQAELPERTEGSEKVELRDRKEERPTYADIVRRFLPMPRPIA